MVRSNIAHRKFQVVYRMVTSPEQRSSNSSFSKGKLIAAIVTLSVLAFALVYQPLPEDFPQPWKYRFLSFGAHIFSKLVRSIVKEYLSVDTH